MTDEEILIKIKTDTGKATKEINRLNKELGKLKKDSNGKWEKQQTTGFKNITKSVGILNKQLIGLAATYLSLRTATSLVTTAADLEEGFLGIAKTTGLAGEGLEELKDSILDLSTEMAGISIEELQSIAETAGQLGISGKENILEFTEVIAMIGATTEMSAEEAATAMAKLGNSMKVDVSDFEKLGSVINELSNTTTATAGDLFDMGQRISGVGKTFGLTADEVLAFSATLTDVGMSAELGGTAISKVMLGMIQDTDKFAKASGVSMEEFSRMIKDEPVNALQTFIEALGNMDKAAKVQTLKDLGLSSSGVTQTMLKLAGATDTLSKNLKTAGEEWKTNTSLQKEYSVFSEAFNAQMEKVGNTIKVLASKIGEELLPKLKELAEDFAEWVNSLDDAKIKEFSEDIAGLVGVLGDAAAAIGRFISAIGGFITNYPTLSKSLLGFIVALKTIQFLLPGVGAAMVTMGTKSVALGAATTKLGAGIGILSTAARGMIALAGPWGIALAAMGTAAALAFNAYQDSAKKAIETNKEVATTMNSAAESTDKISTSLLSLNEQMEKNGYVTQASRAAVVKALEDEKVAIQNQLAEWEKSTTQTNEQSAAAVQLASRIGQISAALDTIPAIYPVNLELETNADEAISEVDQVKDAGERDPIDIKVDADTKPAKSKLDKMADDMKKASPFYQKVDADVKPAKKTIEEAKKEGEEPWFVEYNLDGTKATKTADTVRGEAEKPITADLGFDPDTRAADNARDQVARPIIVPVTYVPTNSPPSGAGYAGGGLVPQRLASGGTFTGSGKVPGYDRSDSDKVNARLTGGEFVVKRRAVDAIGVSTLNKINNIVGSFRLPKMPKIGHFAEGGLVSAAKSAAVSSPGLGDLGTLTLKAGGKDLQVLAPQAVADALVEYIDTQGGL